MSMKKSITKTQNKAIQKAAKALMGAESDWAKKYWFKVWKDLCIKYEKKLN